MIKSTVVRPYDRGEESDIVTLLQTVFNGWPHFDLDCPSIDHWRWKYENNLLRASAVAVAENEGRIVGCSHGFYIKAKLGQRTHIAQQGTDLAILEAYRGMGLYPRMTAVKDQIHMRNNAKLTYGISTNPIVVRSKIKAEQPQFPSQVRHMVKLIDPAKYLEGSRKDSLIKKYGYLTLRTLNRFDGIADTSSRLGSLPPIEIKDQEAADKAIGGLFNTVKDNYNFIIERDCDYIKWRYLDGRGGKYIIRGTQEDDHLLGYTTLSINRFNEKRPEGYIVDILTPLDRLDVAGSLIQDADNFFAERNVNLIHTLTLKGHPYERLFRKHNYVYDRKELILFIRSLVKEEPLDDLLGSPPEKLHIAYGDIDWI